MSLPEVLDVEISMEDEGRWIGEVVNVEDLSVLVYGDTPEDAERRACLAAAISLYQLSRADEVVAAGLANMAVSDFLNKLVEEGISPSLKHEQREQEKRLAVLREARDHFIAAIDAGPDDILTRDEILDLFDELEKR